MEIESFGSICSGVGMQEMAYKEVFNDNINYFSEIDKFAIKSYESIHGDIKNLGDFTKAEDVDLVDFMFASTPCQDFSIGGDRKGFDGMRGTLTFEWIKMLKKLKEENKMPKVIGFENVPGIISEKFIEGFVLFKRELENIGYKIHQGKLNAKYFGLPQNRERVFLIGFKVETDFIFPKGIESKLKLEDILECEVNKKYYLSNEYLERFKKSNLKMNGDMKIIGTTVGTGKGTNSRHWVHDTKGLIGALSATDYKQPKQIFYKGGLRKMTPLEYWRTQGIKDSDFYKAELVNSNCQLYKQAGNGIAVNVLVEIFKEIKKATIIEPCENKPSYDVINKEKQFKLF